MLLSLVFSLFLSFSHSSNFYLIFEYTVTWQYKIVWSSFTGAGGRWVECSGSQIVTEFLVTQRVRVV